MTETLPASAGRALLPESLRSTVSPEPDGQLASRRRYLLERLYGPDLAPAVDAAVTELLAGVGRRGPTRRLDERDAWLISYPDHVSEPGRAPLATLAGTVARHLAPEITGVHTLPLHPSSSDGGFSVRDFARIDPAFGTERDLHALAASTGWMADAVVNHVSASGVWFRRFLAGDPAYAGFFRTLDPATDTTAVVRPRTSPLSHRFERPDGSTVDVWTTFSADQVDLDYRNPAVLVAVLGALLRYVEQGAVAIRLDAVGFLWKDPATSSINLAQTHWLVQLFRVCLDAVDPGVQLVTETNVPHEQNVSYFGLDGEREAQAVYQFALPPLVLHSFAGGSAAALKRWARGLWFPGGDRTYFNFLASHDGIGLRPVEGLLDDAAIGRLVALTEAAGGVVNHRTGDDGWPRPYELAVSWFDAMAEGYPEDVAIRRHVASHTLAMALRGVPLLYLNSLLGASNDVERFARTGHPRDLNRRRFTATELADALAEPASRAARVRSALLAALGLRRCLPAFAPDAGQRVHGEADELVVVERIPAEGPRACVVVNVSGDGVELELPEGRWERLDDAGWGGDDDEATGAQPRGLARKPGDQLEPWESAWFVEIV